MQASKDSPISAAEKNRSVPVSVIALVFSAEDGASKIHRLFTTTVASIEHAEDVHNYLQRLGVNSSASKSWTCVTEHCQASLHRVLDTCQPDAFRADEPSEICKPLDHVSTPVAEFYPLLLLLLLTAVLSLWLVKSQHLMQPALCVDLPSNAVLRPSSPTLKEPLLQHPPSPATPPSPTPSPTSNLALAQRTAVAVPGSFSNSKPPLSPLQPSTATPSQPSKPLPASTNSTITNASTSTQPAAPPAALQDCPTKDIQLGHLLGKGSFGAVYLGTWQGRVVAVKVIEHKACMGSKIAEEARVSITLRHPNIVRCHYVAHLQPLAQVCEQDEGEQVAETWLVQDYCNQGTLTQAICRKEFWNADGRHVDMGAILTCALDVARAVEYLHVRGICHGDLKCSNVLLHLDTHRPNATTIARLCDFGLCHVLAPGRSHRTTRSAGTLTHMAPEMFHQDCQARPASDIYSFGIILWELITGQRPYQGLQDGHIIRQVALNHLRPTFPNWVHPEYVLLAEECWSAQQQARPTAFQVVNRLSAMLTRVDRLELFMSEALDEL